MVAVVRHHLGVLLHAFRRELVSQESNLHCEVALEEIEEPAWIVDAVGFCECVGYTLLVNCCAIHGNRFRQYVTVSAGKTTMQAT